MGITNCHNIMILAVVVMVVELLGGAFALVVVGVVLGITNSHIISAVL